MVWKRWIPFKIMAILLGIYVRFLGDSPLSWWTFDSFKSGLKGQPKCLFFFCVLATSPEDSTQHALATNLQPLIDFHFLMILFMITVSEVEKMPHLEATVISYSGAHQCLWKSSTRVASLHIVFRIAGGSGSDPLTLNLNCTRLFSIIWYHTYLLVLEFSCLRVPWSFKVAKVDISVPRHELKTKTKGWKKTSQLLRGTAFFIQKGSKSSKIHPYIFGHWLQYGCFLK